jgi:hypothetical protein
MDHGHGFIENAVAAPSLGLPKRGTPVRVDDQT